MCGIFGFISKQSSQAELKQTTSCLTQRGPDASGYYYSSPVGLGHRRLSIIDLESGAQPMHSADGQQVLVFNGEIYNFLKIKQELQDLNFEFTTTSDTEVILKAYQAWGFEGCLEKLEGMFAFALWDYNIKKLLIARDRYGEKPLYYIKNEKGVYFASELKALKPFADIKAISKKGLNLFFSLSYIPAPFTIYESVSKLGAGEYMVVDLEERVSINNYYNLKAVVKSGRSKQNSDYEQAKAQLRQLLFESIEKRMISDVPLGSFLSGGIDSSIVSAIMAKVSKTPIKTFSIGFKEKAYDESERAALVAKHIGAEHTLHVLGHEDLLAVVDDTLNYFDEPFGDSSAIPSMMVAKKAKEKVTVVLTGDCADELFGGYEKYLGKHYADKYKTYPKVMQNMLKWGVNKIPHTNATNHTLRKIKKVIQSAEVSPEERYLKLASLGFSPTYKKQLLTKELNAEISDDILSHFKNLGEQDELLQTFYSDVKLVLEGDMLTKVDRACMINSLEARVPFLDSKIVNFSFQLPHEFKIKGINKKRILKETFADLLPEETMSFSKKGFGIPIRLWFQNELKSELLELLEDSFIEEQNLFNKNYIHQLIQEHMSNKENHSSKLWQLFTFQKWYKSNFNA